MSEKTPTLYLDTPGERHKWSFQWTEAKGELGTYLVNYFGIPSDDSRDLALKPIPLARLFTNEALGDDLLKAARDTLLEGLKSEGETEVTTRDLWARFQTLPTDKAITLAQSALDVLLRHSAEEEKKLTERPQLSRRAMVAAGFAGLGLAGISIGTGIAFNHGRKDKLGKSNSQTTDDLSERPDEVINNADSSGKIVPTVVEERRP
ncbi:MAG: hypothetical protein U1E36_02900 [Rickettsiales bacterium]